MRYKEKYKLLPVETKKGRTVYYVRFYNPRTGKMTKVSSGETTAGRARTFADKLLAEGIGSSPRLEDYAKDFFKWSVCPWIKRQHAKGRQFGEYQAKTRRAHLDNYIIPQFGKKRLADLTRPMIENWLVGLELENQTKNHILYSFRIILREAEAEKQMAVDPLAKAEPLGRNHKSRDALTMDELRILFPATNRKLLEIWKSEKYVALFMTMATTGIRSGEARALAWQHILPGGWLFVERAFNMGGRLGETKTRDQRVIPLPARTQAVLSRWRAKSPFTEPDSLIFFGNDADKPLNVKTVTDLFPLALQRAKVGTKGRNIVAHSLRHTYNTVMRAVLPEELLRRFTGHKTPEMTALYDHPALMDQIKQLEPARGLVEAVWKDSKKTKPENASHHMK
jgi:integrase